MSNFRRKLDNAANSHARYDIDLAYDGSFTGTVERCGEEGYFLVTDDGKIYFEAENVLSMMLHRKYN